MGQGTEIIKQYICSLFPGLLIDPQFKITSPETPNYNCIAWAYNINDRWMWPNTGESDFLDGVNFWPTNEIMDTNVQNFIDAFKLKGYECCENSNFEDGYRKIALYIKHGTNECTHASRQLSNGLWTSKLGGLHDIQHGKPENIEGVAYGEVFCIMKRIF